MIVSPGPAVVTASRSEQRVGMHLRSLVSASLSTRSVSGVRVMVTVKQIVALGSSGCVPDAHVATPAVPLASPAKGGPERTPVNVAFLFGSGLASSDRSRPHGSMGRPEPKSAHPGNRAELPTQGPGEASGSMSTRSAENGSLESHNSIRIGTMPSVVERETVVVHPAVDGVLLSATTLL